MSLGISGDRIGIIIGSDFTKAEILYDFARAVIRQYTIYAIVRENFESKDFDQSMWEIWEVIYSLYNTELEERHLKEIIRELSEEIIDRHWKYIDTLVEDVQKNCRTQKEKEDVDHCCKRIEEMKRMEIVDIVAIKEVRQLEEIIY